MAKKNQWPFRDYTNKVVSASTQFVEKIAKNPNAELYGAYKELAKALEPLLQQEIDSAMAGRNWGEGRQMGGSFGGNGTAKVYVPHRGAPIVVSWQGQNILYIEYGTGIVGSEHPYEGEKMIEGYAPEEHGWVFRNIYMEGWEPIAPFYKFTLKLKANSVLSPDVVTRIVISELNKKRAQFRKLLSGLKSENASMNFTFTVL